MDLLESLQGTLKSILQYHSSKTSILWCSAFFIIQLSHPDITGRKTIALTRQTYWQSNVSALQYTVWVHHSFSSKEQGFFNFMAAVTICSDFGAPQNKVFHCFHCFPIDLHVVMGPVMATHSSVLAWRIPGTGEPGELPSIRSHRVGHD